MNKELERLLALLDSVAGAKWIQDEHAKAMWFDAVLERHRQYQKSLQSQSK